VCVSVDLAAFFVGYKSSGVIEKYSVDDGHLLWSSQTHAGDVNTLTELRPGLLCSAGADGRV